MHFEGVIPAVMTPFDASGAIDTAALARNAEWLLDEGCTGLVGTGTMGEAQSLSAAERALVIETLVEAAAGRVTVTAGVSSSTASASIAYAQDAVAAGARALMMLPPLGYEGDAREIEAFYAEVAATMDLPVMAYNNPKASGIDMSPDLVARLAAIDRIVAVKECSGDARRITEILNATDELEVLVGGDDWALEGFCAGATGWISGVANVAPRESIDLHRLCAEGLLDEARAVYERILPLARLDMRPKLVQFFKAGMDAVGREGGPCRPPRLELTESEQREVEEAVSALGAQVSG
jgi:4-hydroxy-tetrahydrodipicolinate synthase